ncbi:MAG: DUF2065 domain-containing protein [Proteobacteria bacterium]|nr:DUF2065 domain-containing protein [Pseudomonadota bacterium]
MTELGLAIALVLVIEGTLYALFPEAMQRMMRSMQNQPAAVLRWTGLGIAALGVGLVWLIRRG